MVATGIAALLSLLGVSALYGSWRRLVPRRFGTPLGWACLGISFVPWVHASNAEFGVVYGFLAAAVSAWLIVAFTHEARRREDEPRPAARPVRVDPRGILRNAGVFFVAVPLAGTCALLLSVLIARLLPWPAVNALVLGFLLLPVLWGLASYWVCADEKPLRPVAGIGFTGALCAFAIYVV